MNGIEQTNKMPDGLPEFEPGWVWLAGAGPGDPGLLTLHAVNGLRQADVVVYDALVDKSILDWVKPGALTDYAGKRGGKPSAKQRDISLQLVDLAQEGKRVLRLKGGGLEVGPILMGMGNRAHIVTPSITARGLLNMTAIAGTPVNQYG